MWLSSRARARHGPEDVAEVGRVTLEGDPAGVYLSSERRSLPLFGPGGYFWRPTKDQEVLVLKTGRDGESPCIVGARCGDPGVVLSPGEALITNGAQTAAVWLRDDGSVEISGGSMTFNGRGLMLVPEDPKKGV